MTDSPELQQWFASKGPALLRRLGLSSQGAVLDFGCGVGSLAIPLAHIVTNDPIYAVDKSAQNLEVLAKRERLYGPFPNLNRLHTRGELQLPSIPPGQCQAGFLFDVLQHIDDWPSLFAECARLLPTGATLHVNPSLLSHPGRVDMHLLESRLRDALFLLTSRYRTPLMHYKKLAEDEVLSFARVTPFQAEVYSALQTVPPGRVTTYAKLAEALAGGSARAVGQAMRRNPCAPRIPCHRVIASDGTLGGFAGHRTGESILKKRQLLAAEGVRFDSRGIIRDPKRIIPPKKKR